MPLIRVALALVCLSAVAGAANRYNILFIAIDDLRAPLGIAGAKYVPTPHLDRLASRGVWFSHHYVQVPTCGASRYSLLTGRSPSQTGVTANNRAFYTAPTALSRTELPGAQTMPELFRRSGYRTVMIGKISHTPDGRVYEYDGSGDGRVELPLAWDELATPVGAWKRGWGTFFAYANGRHREDRSGYQPVMEFLAEDDEDLPDGMMAAEAVAKLRQLKKGGGRFFLAVGFFKPHLPFVATKGDWKAVQEAPVPDAPHPERLASPYWHRSNEFYKYQLPFAGEHPLAKADRLTARRAYLAATRYSDRQVGRLLKALDDLDLARDTVVVVWGDHGWHLGEYAVWGKHTPFERALNSVLIIRIPGATAEGVRCDALVETLDLYPTLIDLCQPSFRKTAHPLDGRSLAPILTGENESVREAAISYWRDAISVRTNTHRLIARRGEKGITALELYDMTGGPDPAVNLLDKQPETTRRVLSMIPD